MKIIIIGSLVCFIRKKSIVFTVKSKLLARLFQMFRSKKSTENL